MLISLLIFLVAISGCTEKKEADDTTIQQIKDSGKLVVGTDYPYEPMEYIDETGEVVGFDIDIANLIADELGVDVEIRDIDFDYLLDAVENGSVDIAIAAITITIERSEKVLFSNPYLNAGQIVIINASNEDIYSEEDLKGKTVGVQSGTTSKDVAVVYTENLSLVVIYNDYVYALENLTAGSIDAIVIDYPAGVGLIRDNPDVEIVGDPFTDELYGIAIKKGETELKALVDKVLSSISISTLENKWF